MNHSIFTQKEYAHLLNTIPEEFYQEIAANEEKKSPEEIKQKIDKLKKETDDWKDTLNQDQKDLVDKFNKIEREGEKEKTLLDKINEDIHVESRFSEKVIPLKRKEEVKTIDGLLKDAPKLDNTTVIQKLLSDFVSLLSKVDPGQNKDTITKQEEAAAKAAENLKAGQVIKELGYLTGTLETKSGLQESHVEITIPGEERGIFFGTPESPKLLFNRDMSLYITESSILQNDQGNDIIKLKAELHTDQTIDFNDNKLAAEKWLAPLTAEFEKFPESEREAVLSNTTGSSYDFNRKLRELSDLKREKKLSESDLKKKEDITLSEDDKNKRDNIDRAINRAQTPSPMVVYRRVDAQQFKTLEKASELQNSDQTLNKKMVEEIKNMITSNTQFINGAYTSTSMSKDPSKNYGGSRPVLLKITVPKGAHAAFIGRAVAFKNLAFADQQEILLPRDSEFKYIKAYESNDNKTLIIEMILVLPK